MRILFCLLIFTSLHAVENETSSSAFSDEGFFRMVVDGNNRLGFELFQVMRKQPGNFCFSPSNIVSGLALVASGAKGDTAHELQGALHYSLSLLPVNSSLIAQFSAQGKSQVLFVDTLWAQKDLPVIASYKLALQYDFGAPLQFIDFAKGTAKSVSTINDWIAQRTNRKLNQVLIQQDVTARTQLLLTTAIYLHGAWNQPFDPRETKRLPFQVTAQKSFMTNMMQAKARYALLKGEGWDLIEIPYHGKQMSLMILLPKKGSLEVLEKQLTWENWQKWLQHLQEQLVSITLPTFRMEDRVELNSLLRSIGISQAFSRDADFSGITNQKGVYLNKAVHKALFVVDDQGAAATSSSHQGTQEAYEFKADHSFLFLIRDLKLNSIILMGRLTMP